MNINNFVLRGAVLHYRCKTISKGLVGVLSTITHLKRVVVQFRYQDD